MLISGWKFVYEGSSFITAGPFAKIQRELEDNCSTWYSIGGAEAPPLVFHRK